MLTFAQLIRKVSSSGATALLLRSEQAIRVSKDGSRRTIGEKLSAAQILNMVNKSLPKEVTRSFRWGHEVRHTLDFDKTPWEVCVLLRSKSEVEVTLRRVQPGRRRQPTGGSDSASHVATLRHNASQIPVIPSDVSTSGAMDPVPAPRQFTPEQTKTIRALSEGDRIGLVYARAKTGTKEVEAALKTFELAPRVTADPAVALEALRYSDFPMTVLLFDGEFAKDPVYRYLKALPMDRRLRAFVTLVAPKMRTGDRLHAFSASVNLVVANKNLNHLSRLITEAHNMWSAFLAPYVDERKRREQQ